MNENNKQNKKGAVKWLILAIFFFVLAMGSVASLILTNVSENVLWIFLGCFPALGFCFYKLNKLGFVDQRERRSLQRPHVYPEELAGIAGKTYVIGDKMRWPYY
jgi:hypothetical protein